MKLYSIASGSSGNCIAVRGAEDYYLVDAGISRKRIVEGLSELGLKPEGLKGIFITHEHRDHVSGLGIFLRKYPVPVFASGKTVDALKAGDILGNVDWNLFHGIEADHPVREGDIRIEASRVFHDAADPVCYTFVDKEGKVGIATDFGTFDDYLVEKFSGCTSVLVEANHDPAMLMAGPYPYPLKRRIRSNTGHISNERAGQFLSRILGKTCRNVLLGHLSKQNNYPDLALESVKLELVLHNINPEKNGICLRVADRDRPTVPDDQDE